MFGGNDDNPLPKPKHHESAPVRQWIGTGARI